MAESPRVRSGWVVLTFAATAAVLLAAVNGLLFVTGLSPSPDSLDDPRLGLASLSTLLAAVAATLVCRLAFHERTGAADARWPVHLTAGLGVGAALMAACVLVPVLAGAATLHGPTLPAATLVVGALRHVLFLGPAAVGEELLLRGVPLQALSRGLGQRWAVALTGLSFGALHLLNPNASPVAAAVIGLVGLLFGTLTVRSGSIWMAVGVHAAWNWCEGFLFGQPVSGVASGAAILTTPGSDAPGFWSGGPFGPEASGWTAVVLAAALAAALAWPRRARQPTPGSIR